jgi:metal-responsive CopG/Arc/MetJ family transcriptional regulator
VVPRGQKIIASFPASLLGELNLAANRLHKTRSAFIRDAVAREVARIKSDSFNEALIRNTEKIDPCRQKLQEFLHGPSIDPA